MNTDLLPRDGRILCAVSGGADSMYLLFRLRELGYDAAAAHFNHGIRGKAADRDEAFVRDICKEHGIPFLSEKGDATAYARENGLGLEDAARRLRYAFLDRAADALGAAVIATAHTADDNAETVLMHLVRGAGLRGLCGIPPVRGRIVRPILDDTHDDALSYLSKHGLPNVEDETNACDDMTRNRLRHSVMPALKQENPALTEAICRMTALLREDEAYLSGLADRFIREKSVDESLPAGELAALPRPVALRVVRGMAGGGITAQQAEAVLHIAANGGYADVTGTRIGTSGGRIFFGVSEADTLPDRTLSVGQFTALPEKKLLVKAERIPAAPQDVYTSFNTFFLKCANIDGDLIVGARRPGDTIRPAGRHITKSVRRLLAESGVPAWQRGAIPVIRDGRGVLGIYGVAVDERVCAQPGDEDIMRLEFIREDT